MIRTLLLFLLLFNVTLFAQTGNRIAVAVMNWDAGGLDEPVVVALSDRLRTELLNTGKFDVMERNRMDDILREQGFQQTGCTSTGCMVEVGQILGVDRMLAGSIAKVGRMYTLTLQMIDIEKGRIIMSRTEDCDCPIETVLTQSIRNIANKIAGNAVTSPAPIVTGQSQYNSSATEGTMTDIDGNVYKTVKIGNQWWMAEDLRVTHYRNGDAIPNVTDNYKWTNLTTGAFCYYDNKSSYGADYGALYNWYAATDTRSLAPAGWHVPTDQEWQALVDYLGGEGVAGGKLKETGTRHWKSPNSGATNTSGFTARPGGYRDLNSGNFNGMGGNAYYWSATERSDNVAWRRNLYYYSGDVYRNYNYGRDGFSIRLVRD